MNDDYYAIKHMALCMGSSGLANGHLQGLGRCLGGLQALAWGSVGSGIIAASDRPGELTLTQLMRAYMRLQQP